MIKAVLIDIDDTLLSFSGYVRQTMKDGFAHFGLPEYNESMYRTFKTINDGLWKQIEQGSLTFDELMRIRWNRIFRALNIDFDGTVFEKYFRKALFDSAIPEPGAKELLEYLSGRYIVCAASNGSYAQQMNRLRVGGFCDYFRYFFLSEKIGAQKPSRAFFDACMHCIKEKEQMTILPEEIMIIGDSVSADIAGAKQCGLKTCLYTGDRTLPEPVSDADYTVSRLTDIMRIL